MCLRILQDGKCYKHGIALQNGRNRFGLTYPNPGISQTNTTEHRQPIGYCSVSRWRPQKVDKRMVLEYTHGLFIT